MTRPKPHTNRLLEIHSRTELLGQVRAFVAGAAREYGFGPDEVAAIELAVDEAITNIIKHGYKYDPAGVIRVEITTQDRGNAGRFVISISDSGVSFDRTQYTPPDMPEYFRKLRRGGLGLVLMNKLMDEVEYDTNPGATNHLRLVKYLPRTGAISR